MSDFDPKDHDRVPRQDGYTEETHKIFQLIHNREDLRIGQLILNAILDSEVLNEFMEEIEND